MNAFPENRSAEPSEASKSDAPAKTETAVGEPAPGTADSEDLNVGGSDEIGASSEPTPISAANSSLAGPTPPIPFPEPDATHSVHAAKSLAVSEPAWTGLDVLRLTLISVILLFVGVLTVVFAAHLLIYPRLPIGGVARLPLVIVAGQAFAYLLILGYMYILVTRERGQPDFFAAIHWNWPANPAVFLLGGVVLSIALQLLSHLLPVPKTLPIDTFFSTPAEAWALTIFGITLAPLIEELFFRGFLYPVLAHPLGVTPAIFISAFFFALLHGAQLSFSWGPVLVIFLVGVVLAAVRAYKNSVASGLVIHVAYNGTISALMFIATDGFRHLEKLNQ